MTRFQRERSECLRGKAASGERKPVFADLQVPDNENTGTVGLRRGGTVGQDIGGSHRDIGHDGT